jgi:Secretion system C-terminal sorting domain
MKKALLFPLFFFITFLAFGQQFPQRNYKELKPEPVQAQPSPAGEVVQTAPGVPASTLGFRTLEQYVGQTRFDLQTANSLGRRVAAFGDDASAIWLHGLDDVGGWPGRGTAYNHSTAGAWGTIPNARVEVTRSGYPSFTRTADGHEVILSHKNTSATQWYLQAIVKLPGETEWTEYELPSAVTGGPVWAKVAAGGPNGNTLHVVAVAVAPAYGGVIYEGVSQHPLYWRSPDGGLTWDKQDIIIPGLDSTFYSNVAGEAYQIEANGETVVIAVFDSWGDVAIFKSEDNGETWAKTIVRDFPLDKYDGTGYGPGDIPVDTLAPDSIAILTSDGAGSIAIGNDGKVHVFFGWMYVEASYDTLYYFPSMSGLAYWNEDYTTDEIYTIADLEDFDGDDLVTLAGIAPYGSSLTSQPAASVDGDGNLYVVYSAVREDYINDDQNQNYRRLFIVKSEDGGATWTAPFDLINEETTDPDFISLIEAAFPSIPPHIGNAIHLVYQQDFNPGMAVSGDSHDFFDNYMVYLKLDKYSFGTVSSVDETQADLASLKLTPNPATVCAKVSYQLAQMQHIRLSLINLPGDRILLLDTTQPAGFHQELVDVKDLATGVYFVQLEVEGQVLTEKLVVER